MQRTGLILISHGTRSVAGTYQFLELATWLSQRFISFCVAPAFLEMQQPDLDTAVGQLIDRGVDRMVSLPLLLFAAGHAKRDVPQQISAALARRGCQNINLTQAAHLGCHPALVELSQRRMEEATSVGRHKRVRSTELAPAQQDVCLLLVGRGSYDDSA